MYDDFVIPQYQRLLKDLISDFYFTALKQVTWFLFNFILFLNCDDFSDIP